MTFLAKLTDLEPEWLKWMGADRWGPAHSLVEADGIMFLCPKCFVANGGPIGTHMVVCWKPHVPKTTTPGPGRWSMSGSGFHDLTLHPSVNVTGDWHGFIQNGNVTG